MKDRNTASDSLSILTIEDEDAVRASLVDFFQDNGHTVFEAADGIHGLSVFRECRPDIVLTDLCMPNGNGMDLIPLLRDESPHTPVVVISGAGKLEDAVEAMKRGAWDYIAKPIRKMQELETVVQSLVRRSRESSANFCIRSQNPAAIDPLTGLPGRCCLESAFIRETATPGKIRILLLDIDDLKMINDTLGHHIGDLLLHQVARRLLELIQPDDLLVRLCADKFAIMSRRLTDADAISFLDNFNNNFSLGEREIFVTLSGGVACFPDDAVAIDGLIRCADMAMEEVKSRVRGRLERFSPGFGTRLHGALDMTTRLRRALEMQEFFLNYQPQVETSTGRIVGVEALLRWQPSEGGMVSPAVFIPLLEESGMIIPVGEWVLRSACAQYSAWMKAGIAPFRLSVNISALQFHSGELFDTVLAVLSNTGMDPANLCLELTEGIVMRDVDETISLLSQLESLGVALSIDDFGTGYSSLGYLLRMPIDEIKIDRTFINGLPGQREHLAIITAIVTMASAMRFKVVAEGVETEEQLSCLKDIGCHVVQGFYFSRPLNVQQVESFLEAAYATPCRLNGELLLCSS